jgi:hypothetical protein
VANRQVQNHEVKLKKDARNHPGVFSLCTTAIKFALLVHPVPLLLQTAYQPERSPVSIAI